MNYYIASALVLLCLIALLIPNSLQDKTYVHLVPHSHWDVGWLKTAEEYFQEEVQVIIENVLVQLEKNPKRKFVFSEMHYMSRWWNDPKTKSENRVKFINMLKNKQIEIVGGGWTMPDEALTTYGAYITTVTRGHQWIKHTFGEDFIPKISWRIDPFGVSPAVTDILRLSGMDKTVVMRTPFDMEDTMRAEKNLEFWWTREHPLQATTKVLTHIMDIQYCIYDMFFNWYGHTNKFNLQSRASYFMDEIEKRARGYKPDSYMIPYGCDFKFYDAEQRFQQVEPLIDSINENRDEVTVSYSLLSEYFEKVEKKSPSFTSFGGSFVPYADGRQAWWTGYYTSYSNMKRATRTVEATLRTADTLYALAKIHGPNTDAFTKWFTEFAQPALDLLRKTVADVTHHDAITGTSKRYVTKSYMDIINKAVSTARPVILKSLQVLAATNQGDKLNDKIQKIMNTKESEMTFTERIDIKQLQTEDEHVPVVVFNDMAWDKLNEVNSIKLLITESPQPQGVKLCLRDSHYNSIPFQIVKPYWDLEKLDNLNEFHLFFTTPRVPALGYVTYYLSKCAVETPVTTRVPVETVSDTTQEITYKISNGILEVGLCNITTICSLKNLKSGKSMFSASGIMNLLEYTGANDGGQKSGAYIFRPAGNGDSPYTRPTRPEGVALLTLVNNGTIVKEIRQKYSEYMYLIIRMYENSDQLEIEYFVNQLFPADKEMVLRMSSNIQNNRVLYTDNNGFDMQKREYDTGRPVAGNFAPIVYKSYIKDQNTQLSLFTSQTHSIASLYEGAVELMLHRRTLYDDNRGVGESVADSSRIQGTIRLTLDAPVTACQESKFARTALSFNFPTILFIDSIVKTTGDQSPKLQLSSERLQLFDPLKKQLPHNLHLLTLEYSKSLVEPDQVINDAEEILLLRVQELTDYDCLGGTSFPASINLNDYFFKNKDIQKLSESRMNGLGEPVDTSKDILAVDNKLKMYPLSIRTLTSAAVTHNDKVTVQSPDFGFQISFSVILSIGIAATALVMALALGCVGITNVLFPNKNPVSNEDQGF